MTRILAAMFLVLAFAPLAHAQTFDCSSVLMQRVCTSPELIPLEEERRGLISELQFIDPAHPAIQGEAAWLASQEACADDACLAAGYAEHNQTLGAALTVAGEPQTELAPAPEEAPPPRVERRDEAPASPDGGLAVQPNEYFVALGIWLVTLLIAIWLLSAAARARRADRGE